ncbi:MAG: hypothetical protein P8L18_09785, partial [Verrucomicrobiota bacterium]|nr:hypothetical protein [Verrucomicrobiota bacterium]
QTRYHARYAKVLSFTQDVTVKTEMTPEGHVFKGQQDLGRLAGGIYAYDGGVTNGTYHAQYRSKYDHGSFLMHRPTWQALDSSSDVSHPRTTSSPYDPLVLVQVKED